MSLSLPVLVWIGIFTALITLVAMARILEAPTGARRVQTCVVGAGLFLYSLILVAILMHLAPISQV